MKRNVSSFNEDVKANEGYRYTTNSQWSSVVANKRITDVLQELYPLTGKKVIDIGCGDGTYTLEMLEMNPESILGVDPAEEAVEIARKKSTDPRLKFEVGSAYELPFPDGTFDVAQLRGVLHHVDNPQAALKEALRVAKSIVVMEPNGYNLGLKILEKVSPYHVEHEEQSFTSKKLRQWVEEAGGKITRGVWRGQVPMFCSTGIAKFFKAMEPLTEAFQPFAALTCAQFIFRADVKSSE